MGYADTAALANDPEFSARLVACVTTESVGRPDDSLANAMLGNVAYIPGAFMPIISSAPGFDTKYVTGGQAAITDSDLLSAVQSSWERVKKVHGS